MGIRNKVFLLVVGCCFTATYSYGQNMGGTGATDTVKHTGAVDSVKKPAPVIYSAPHYIKPKIKGPKPIRKELSVGLRLNTDGWGFFVDKGFIRSLDSKYSDLFHNIKLWQFEFEENKNPHEIKSSSSDQTTSTGQKANSFIYGKINNFYALKVGIGFRKMIAGKPDPGTTSIHWVGVGGLSLGLLKPYYIKAYYNGSEQTIKYTDQTKETFINPGDILGSAGFSQGLDETKPIPGAHFKTGLHFDFAANRKTVLAVETGVNAEIYTQAIPLMAGQKAVPYFFNLYASFQFGKRW